MRENEQKNASAVETGADGANSGTVETGTEAFAEDSVTGSAAQNQAASGSAGAETAPDAGEAQDTDGHSASGEENQDGRSADKGRNPENADAAERRRAGKQKMAEILERERTKAAETARAEGRVQAIIELLDGENPYTHTPMKDATDVEIYLQQKAIEKNGGDPVSGYAAAVAEVKRTAAEKEQAEAQRNQWFENDLAAFAEAHPDINVAVLLADKDFGDYAEGKVGVKPLSEIYDGYIGMTERYSTAAREKAEREAAQKLANAEASAGSVRGRGAPKMMSRAELLSKPTSEIMKIANENPGLYRSIMNGH